MEFWLVGKFLIIALETIALYCSGTFLCRVIRPYFSPLRNLPGPPSSGFIHGNAREARRAGPVVEEWYKKYSKVMKCKGRFGVRASHPSPIGFSITNFLAFDRPGDATFYS